MLRLQELDDIQISHCTATKVFKCKCLLMYVSMYVEACSALNNALMHYGMQIQLGERCFPKFKEEEKYCAGILCLKMAFKKVGLSKISFYKITLTLQCFICLVGLQHHTIMYFPCQISK